MYPDVIIRYTNCFGDGSHLESSFSTASALSFSLPWFKAPPPPPPPPPPCLDHSLVLYWIVLLAVLSDFANSLISSLLNFQRLSPKMPRECEPRECEPRECEGIYNAAAYRPSQEYTKAKTKYSLLHSAFDTLDAHIFPLLTRAPISHTMWRSSGGALEYLASRNSICD